MDYNKLSTDNLVDIIVRKVVVPIPSYNYNEYRKFISVVPENIRVGTVQGIENANMHDTFRDACLRVIHWWESTR